MTNISLKTSLLLLLTAICSTVSGQEVISAYSLINEGGTVTTSAINETVPYLTDKNENTAYSISAGKNSWIQVEFNSPKIVTGYTLVSYDDKTKDPKNWQILGSNDGTSWTVLSSETGVLFDHRYKAMGFSTGLYSTLIPYKFYRLLVYRTSILAADGPLNIAEWQLFGLPSYNITDVTDNGGQITGQYPGLENFNEILSNLTDNDTKNKYTASAKTLWVQYESSTPVKLSSYSLTSGPSFYNRNPRSWEILGSNDGTEWKVLDAQYNRTFYDIPSNQLWFKLPFEETRTYNWADYATKAQNTLYNTFWNTTGYYYNQEYYPVQDSLHTGYNYWWNAHVMDVLVDAYSRTKSPTYTQRMTMLKNGVFAKCASGAPNKWWNTFYDDMEWMGLATFRAYEATGDQTWKTASIDLWNMIKGGWTTVNGGGIMWASGSPNSKNACSNAPAMILAAKLYKLTGQQTYLDWAKKIQVWMADSLVDANTGLVWDGVGNHNYGNCFTYNQGTYMGGCVELYNITKEQKYLDAATKIADYVMNPASVEKKFSIGGILTGEGTADGGLFKGIYMRYLQQFIRYKILDSARQEKYIRYFLENGKSVWNAAVQKPEIVFSNTWMDRLPVTQKRDLSTHVSGVMFFENLAEMEREGLLNVNAKQFDSNCDVAYKYFRFNQLLNRGDTNSQLSEMQLFTKEMIDGLNDVRMRILDINIYTCRSEIIIKNDKLKNIEFSILDTSGKIYNMGKFSNSIKSIQLGCSGVFIICIRSEKFTAATKVVLP